MLACGGLHIEVLDEGENWNETAYVELIEDKFDTWAGNCEFLVCDHERILRGKGAVHALSKTCLKLLEGYPRVSQDFNAIENAWKIVKDRLDETMPIHLEMRDAFVHRLQETVKWVNKNRSKQLWHLSTNQKERADECLSQKPPGGRTSF